MKHDFDLANFCYTSFKAQPIYLLHDMIYQTAFDFDYMTYLLCLTGEIQLVFDCTSKVKLL